MRKRAIINFASGRYKKDQQRLINQIHKVGFDGETLIWTDNVPSGSSNHASVPYQFKVYAFENALKQGFTSVLWMDAVIYPNQSFNRLFDIIEQDGYLIFLNGWTTGQWCADSALIPLGITRDESFNIPHALACVMGFDFANKKSYDVFLQWKHSSDHAFPGPWSNDSNQASSDSRVLGHRHDQTAISVFAHRAGWKFRPPGDDDLLCYGSSPKYLLNSFPS